MEASLTRRSLVAGAATVAAGALAATTTHTARAATADFTFADTVAWNAEYDVVVIGYGAAGGVAAIYAADAGAHVLLCDSAPEGEEGGNSRVACQMMVAADDPEKAYTYYKDGLAWHFDVDEEALRAYTDGISNIESYLEYLGVAPEDLTTWPNTGSGVCPEYPEYEGGDTIYEVFVAPGGYNSSLYKLIRKNVIERADAIDVWCSSPAVHLVQDPQTKTIVGVELERDGASFLVRAANGVVLACGGFENNPTMVQDYLGIARAMPIGGMYNQGAGVRMGIEVGADQWHMDAYESLGILSGNAFANDETGRAMLEVDFSETKRVPLISLASGEYGTGSVMLVGDDGDRFINESAPVVRHGHVYSNGVWRNPIANWSPWLVFDQTELDWWQEIGRLSPERVEALVSADTAEELAEKTGVDPEILARTIQDFNFFVDQGRDYKLNRSVETMRKLEGTLYAAQMRPAILNTQGGPRRNGSAQVLDTAGNPIPHLYSAGELGGITAFQYNSGGNLAECIISGSAAGIGAAAEKEPLPPVELPEAVSADIKLTPER